MKSEVYAFEPPSPALAPELALLIDRGVLSRAENDNPGALGAFETEVEHAVARGAVTATQARTMGQLLGVRAAA